MEQGNSYISMKKSAKSVDGKLPDIDYNEMRMKNLDELNGDKTSAAELCITKSTGALDCLCHNYSDHLTITGEENWNAVDAKRQITCNCRLVKPTQVVHTTPDRLTQTMHMQQRLFQMRLTMTVDAAHCNSQFPCCSNRLPTACESTNQSNFQNSSLTSLMADKSSLQTTQQSKTYENNHLNRWIVRKRMDGTRYITRRYSSVDSSLKNSCERENVKPIPTHAKCHKYTARLCASSCAFVRGNINLSTQQLNETKADSVVMNTSENCSMKTLAASNSKSGGVRPRKVLLPHLILDDRSDTLLSVTTL